MLTHIKKISYLDAISKIKALADKTEYPISIPLPDELDRTGLVGQSSFFNTITSLVFPH